MRREGNQEAISGQLSAFSCAGKVITEGSEGGCEKLQRPEGLGKEPRTGFAVYTVTRNFPRDELYGLTSQMRRAAASTSANIAEGGGDAEFGRFLQTAMGSASELEYLTLLARDLGHLKDSASAQLADQITEVKRMLASLLQRIKLNAEC